MAIARKTPTCSFCGEVIAKAVYRDQSKIPPMLRLIGDTFVRWDYIEHTCKGKIENTKIVTNMTGTDINFYKTYSRNKILCQMRTAQQIINRNLLKPRYKVIALYPDSNLIVGEIIDLVEPTVNIPKSVAHFNKYPHIFKKLGWWEYRLERDMPEYVKYNDKNHCYTVSMDKEPIVHQVKRHFSSGKESLRDRNYDSFVSMWHDHDYTYSMVIPATKNEYLNQNKSRNLAR